MCFSSPSYPAAAPVPVPEAPQAAKAFNANNPAAAANAAANKANKRRGFASTLLSQPALTPIPQAGQKSLLG